jgi:hypothetical protein
MVKLADLDDHRVIERPKRRKKKEEDAKTHGTGVVLEAAADLAGQAEAVGEAYEDLAVTRENIEAVNTRERMLADLGAKLREKERRFVDAWVVGHVDPKQAMRVAGYSDSTISQKGPIYLFRKRHVMDYANALCEGRVDAVADVIKAQLLRLEMALPVALNTLIVMAAKAANEAVRVRAASVIVDLAKGILIASLPKKSVDFTELMRAIYEEAKEERKSLAPKSAKPEDVEEVEWEPWVKTVEKVEEERRKNEKAPSDRAPQDNGAEE